jgi:segregation and condensation protein A
VAPARLGEEGPTQASFTASTLSASLELVKEGAMDVKQAEAFADLYLKRRGRGRGQVLELVP